ncbi:hypothetical protein BDB00DRAFT_829392 [Zychaea mexicana]|uniref:uncharacterized protein n=1 Tax=Zychaea mexicana TaxID=64656 RepID=UPI0022FED4B4|nr:uncharacterized protein BDB00DRAFT_829392 [Zychaea mexicana]KAI9492152.1 hypothetical protein BDB00DRAFT_829392 [Zychaea mexicana]
MNGGGSKTNSIDHTRASSSSVEDRMEGVEMTQEEEQQIEETLLAHKVKEEPHESSSNNNNNSNINDTAPHDREERQEEALGANADSDTSMKEEIEPVTAQAPPAPEVTIAEAPAEQTTGQSEKDHEAPAPGPAEQTNEQSEKDQEAQASSSSITAQASGEATGEGNTPAQTSSHKKNNAGTAMESEEEGEVISSGKSVSPGPSRQQQQQPQEQAQQKPEREPDQQEQQQQPQEQQQSEAVAAAVASAVASTVIAPLHPTPTSPKTDTSSQVVPEAQEEEEAAAPVGKSSVLEDGEIED